MKFFTLTLAAGLSCSAAAHAQAQTKVACVGEATTHSAHRNYDPEYPQLTGEFLDADFMLGPGENPLDGGMLYGSGSGYRVGNFGLPTGVAVDVDSTEVASTIRSPQLTMAEEFDPDVVILGPYGPHEPYADVSLETKFAPDLKALAQRILAFPSKPTVFIAIPIPRWGEDSDTVRRNIRDWTIQVADELALPKIDLWSEFLGKRAEFQDQNHLALAGRQRMGRFIGAAIKDWKVSTGGTGGTGGAASGGSSGAASGGLDGGTSSAGAAAEQPGAGGVSGANSALGGTGSSAMSGGAGNAAGGASLPAGGATSPPLGAAPVDQERGCSVQSPRGAAGGWLLAVVGAARIMRTRRRHRAPR